MLLTILQRNWNGHLSKHGFSLGQLPIQCLIGPSQHRTKEARRYYFHFLPSLCSFVYFSQIRQLLSIYFKHILYENQFGLEVKDTRLNIGGICLKHEVSWMILDQLVSLKYDTGNGKPLLKMLQILIPSPRLSSHPFILFSFTSPLCLLGLEY